MVVAASASRMVSAAATATTAAAARKPSWNAARLGTACPATSRAGPAVASTVVSRATPMAPPNCLPALKADEARPIWAWAMVAIDAAWAGMNTNEMPKPRPSMTSRTSHRLVPVLTRCGRGTGRRGLAPDPRHQP
jgi:hypothetical protein